MLKKKNNVAWFSGCIPSYQKSKITTKKFVEVTKACKAKPDLMEKIKSVVAATKGWAVFFFLAVLIDSLSISRRVGKKFLRTSKYFNSEKQWIKFLEGCGLDLSKPGLVYDALNSSEFMGIVFENIQSLVGKKKPKKDPVAVKGEEFYKKAQKMIDAEKKKFDAEEEVLRKRLKAVRETRDKFMKAVKGTFPMPSELKSARTTKLTSNQFSKLKNSYNGNDVHKANFTLVGFVEVMRQKLVRLKELTIFRGLNEQKFLSIKKDISKVVQSNGFSFYIKNWDVQRVQQDDSEQKEQEDSEFDAIMEELGQN